MQTVGAGRGGLLLTGVVMAAMLGCGDDAAVCAGVVAVGTQDSWAGLLKTDGSAWTWRPGYVEPDGRPAIRLEHAGATGFSSGGICLKLATGDVTCQLDSQVQSLRDRLDSVAQELSYSAVALATMCAVLFDGTLTCFLPEGGDAFSPVAQGIRHASLGSTLCAITEQGRFAIPWPLPGQASQTIAGQADWSMAGASLTDVVETVALQGIPGCVARTTAGEIWSISEDYGTSQTLEAVEKQVVGVGGPVSQLVTGRDLGGEFVCALVMDGTVYCWNEGGPGGLVAPDQLPDFTVAQKVPGLPGPAMSLAGGTGYVCAVLQDSTIWCWGLGQNGGARVSSCGH